MTPTSSLDVQPESQFAQGVSPRRKLFGAVMTASVMVCALLAALPLVSILWTVITNGIAHLSPQVFTELPPPPMVEGGGLRNALMGTFWVLLIGSLISVPFGILVAVYVSEFARDTRFANFVRFGINVLSGVPSIVAGLFAYGVVVLVMGSFSAWAGGVALAVLMLPIVERTAEEGLKSIPQDIRQGAIGLGATNFQTISQIVLPSALPFIATGVTLSLARAIGETAPLLFTALFSQFDTDSLSDPTATLSVLIYNFSSSPFQNQKDLAWVASLLVVSIILVVSIVARRIAKRQAF